MKHLLIYTVLFIPANLLGQISIRNESLKNDDSLILYYGIDNKLQIPGNDKRSSVQVKADGILLKPVDTFYFYRPNKMGYTTIDVLKNGKRVAATQFRVDKTGEIALLVANSANLSLAKYELLAKPYLSLTLLNCNYNLHFIIRSFNCLIKNEQSGATAVFRADSEKFTADMLDSIRKLKKGSIIRFERINVGWEPEYCPRQMEDVEITVN